jgi:hypothetical protein
MRVLRAAAFAALVSLEGCAKLTLAWADLDAAGPTAAPPLETASLQEWESRGAPAARALLQEYVYGYFPDFTRSEILDHRVLNADAFNGKGRLEEYRIGADAGFSGVNVGVKSERYGAGFLVDVVVPKDAKGPVPVILMETFCPRSDTLPDPAIEKPKEGWTCDGPDLMNQAMIYVFGRYIATPPIEAILDAGYAIAALYPDEVVPDRRDQGLAELKRLSAGYEKDETRWGAIAAWAWTFSRVVDALEQDDRFDKNAMITWGHSRYAKAALVAAAFDSRIDGVIAHQSGTGGASLSKGKRGESVGEITGNYPHWFDKRHESFAGREEGMPVDQHALLALIAPRPVLLGNARRDVWSDPAGAFRAAKAADAVYELYGVNGLTAKRLDQFDPKAELSFWIRPGTHGVVKEDWPAFLAFLNAHFSAQADQ